MEFYQFDNLGFYKTAMVISCSCYLPIEDWQGYSAHHSGIWVDGGPPSWKLLVASGKVEEGLSWHLSVVPRRDSHHFCLCYFRNCLASWSPSLYEMWSFQVSTKGICVIVLIVTVGSSKIYLYWLCFVF